MFGDCYRRDEIDASHYPVFHQTEGVRVWQRSAEDVRQSRLTVEWLVSDLQATLDGLVDHLFGSNTPRRWLDDSFPFTSPSLQVEVQFHGRWMEVLGCGVIQPAICQHFTPRRSAHTQQADSGGTVGEGRGEVVGWAFGLGLERLAMVLFDIPDIRLFWSDDPRFIRQFEAASATSSAQHSSSSSFHSIRFVPFSKFPATRRDLSLWLPDPAQPPARGAQGQSLGDGGVTMSDLPAATSSPSSASFHENDLYAVIREVAGDLVESVEVVGADFVQPDSARRSRCYRITYRHMSSSLTHTQVNAVHERVRHTVEQRLPVQLR